MPCRHRLRRMVAVKRMDLASFKKIVYGLAQQAGGKVDALYAPDVTPNFFAARLDLADSGEVYVLCSMDGHWAFSSQFTEHECHLRFVDSPLLAGVLSRSFGVKPMLKQQLEGPYKRQPHHSEADIKYWAPETLGEGIFNWWD